MALIGTLRNKMGTWVVVFVFVAIAAFIVGDLFSGNSSILNWGQKNVGEIAGREVSIDEFQSAIRERESNYALQFNRQPGDRGKCDRLGNGQHRDVQRRMGVRPEFSEIIAPQRGEEGKQRHVLRGEVVPYIATGSVDRAKDLHQPWHLT